MRISTEEESAPEPTTHEQPQEDNKSEVSKYLSSIGRKGGLKGGKSRADKLSQERRKEIAKKAASARWGSKDIKDR